MTIDSPYPGLAVVVGTVVVCLLPGVSCPTRRANEIYAPASPRRSFAAERGGNVLAGPPPTRPAPAPAATDYAAILDYIWLRESSRGQDRRCWQVGPAGEYGEFQVTPPFLADVQRIGGYVIDRADNASCRAGIEIWLRHYAPRVGAVTTDELYRLYNMGPGGYRKWKGRKP